MGSLGFLDILDIFDMNMELSGFSKYFGNRMGWWTWGFYRDSALTLVMDGARKFLRCARNSGGAGYSMGIWYSPLLLVEPGSNLVLEIYTEGAGRGRESEEGKGEWGTWGFDVDSGLTLVIGGARKFLGALGNLSQGIREGQWRVGSLELDSVLTLVIGGARKSLGAGDSLPSSSQSLFLSTSSWLNCK